MAPCQRMLGRWATSVRMNHSTRARNSLAYPFSGMHEVCTLVSSAVPSAPMLKRVDSLTAHPEATKLSPTMLTASARPRRTTASACMRWLVVCGTVLPRASAAAAQAASGLGRCIAGTTAAQNGRILSGLGTPPRGQCPRTKSSVRAPGTSEAVHSTPSRLRPTSQSARSRSPASSAATNSRLRASSSCLCLAKMLAPLDRSNCSRIDSCTPRSFSTAALVRAFCGSSRISASSSGVCAESEPSPTTSMRSVGSSRGEYAFSASDSRAARLRGGPAGWSRAAGACGCGCRARPQSSG